VAANEIAGDDKEDVDSSEAASQQGHARMKENHAQHCDGADSVDVWAI
jgi:hypothetical protein